MVLIAATALGIAGAREAADYLGRFDAAFQSVQDCLEYINRFALFGLPLVLAWTVAILVLRLLPPRPSRRHLRRQPGMIASLTVTGTAVLGAAFLGIAILVSSNWAIPRFMLWGFRAEFHGLPLVFVPAIQTGLLCSWMTLAVSGRWRAERSWIDRAGRLIGIVWLVGLPFTAVFWLVELLD
jgi:hypothetical protein